MCEQYVARAASAFELGALWDFTARLERYGVSGFGWGTAWLAEDGGLRSYRHAGAFRDDPATVRLGRETTTSLLVHLRRPSRLSTLGLPDTQPFDDPAGRYAFSHNGGFKRDADWRERYVAAGRIHGKADTEVGARWLEDAWPVADESSDGDPVPRLLGELHDTFGGNANLAVLTSRGAVHHYAGNAGNPVYAFRLGDIGLVTTALHSPDDSLFELVIPAASDRVHVPLRSTVSLDPTGAAGVQAPVTPGP